MTFLKRASRFLKSRGPSSAAASQEETQRLRSQSLCDASTVWINEIDELDIMADYLYRATINADWVPKRGLWPVQPEDVCVVVRSVQADTEVVRPDCEADRAILTTLTRRVEAQAAFTMRNDLTKKFLQRIPPMSNVVKLIDGHTINVFESSAIAASSQKPRSSGVCLIRDIDAAFIWTNDAKNLIMEGQRCEQALSTMLWTTSLSDTKSWALQNDPNTICKGADPVIEVRELALDDGLEDIEVQRLPQRETRLVWPVIVALTFSLMGCAIGKLLSELVLAIVRDRIMYQILFLLYVPLSCFFSGVRETLIIK